MPAAAKWRYAGPAKNIHQQCAGIRLLHNDFAIKKMI